MWRNMWLLGAVLSLWLSVSLRAEVEDQTSNPPKDPIIRQLPKPPAIPPAAPASILVSNANEYPVIYNRLMANNYTPGQKHVTAVARMVNCLFDVTAEQKADSLNEMILKLNTGGTENNVRRIVIQREINFVGGDIRRSGQAAYLAAILLCKIGSRTFEQLLNDYDLAILELEKVTARDLKVKDNQGRDIGLKMPTDFIALITAAELLN